ncbi:hypothetical protein CSUB_C0755 [Candidatus Caldarchaeum subterraneum]|uniref:Glycoside hydrolase family 5 domain-containing protein n=1 Tax=Caldiarchaeum subterraneum TaxID=311458 RepID=E6N607_CALS0|nr:hypothetical protein HGMM_F13A09C09 [Candidatus Caldarchaeum subterraneum]BAJ49432.1 hypothetical protein HGMM_F15D08C23 [Candidatus Caldarchaeum subterraneum]BAJ50613.1 hypothetical protein CSUB_C0755 [Candidatus Caldarchaeum subterraneum]
MHLKAHYSAQSKMAQSDDGDKQRRTISVGGWRRRGVFRVLGGVVIGVLMAEGVERLYFQPMNEESLMRELLLCMDRYIEASNKLDRLSSVLKDKNVESEEMANRVAELELKLENLDKLESESYLALFQIESDVDAAIAGMNKILDRYQKLVGEENLAFERKTVEIMENLRDTKTELASTLKDLASYRARMAELQRIKDYLEEDLKSVMRTARGLSPSDFFGANMRSGLDAWSKKTENELILQILSAREMELNVIRIVIDVWKYAQPYQHLPSDALRAIMEVVDMLWRAGLYVIVTFDKVMWMDSDSTKFWVGYRQYKEAIMDVVNMLRLHPAVVAYDLSNEPVLAIEAGVTEGKISRREADEWIKGLTNVYRVMRNDIVSRDPFVTVTVGDAEPDYSKYFIDVIDFVSFHNTGIWSPYPEEDTWDGTLEDLRRRLSFRIERAKALGKPVVLEEYGVDPNFVYGRQLERMGKVVYHPLDYYRVILDEVYSHGIGALFWVININVEDPWNLAISDEGSLTEIGETIKDYAIKFNERILEKVVRRYT